MSFADTDDQGGAQPPASGASPGEHRLRALVDNVPDFLAILDASGLIRYISPGAEGVIGYRPDEMLGRAMIEFVHPEDNTQALNDFAALLESREKIIATRKYRHKAGSWRRIETTSRNLLGDPQVNGIVVSTRDVTPREPAQCDASNLETRYRMLVEESFDAIYFLDSAGRFVDVNDATCKLFGYTNAELLGMNITEIIDPDDLRLTPFNAETLRSGQPLVIDRRIKRKDGGMVRVEIGARMLSNGLTKGIAHDVTERRRLEQAAKDSEQRLRVALRMVNMTVCSQDPALRFTWIANPPAFLTEENVIGQRETDLLSPGNAERILDIKRRVLETGVPARTEVSLTINSRALHVDMAVEPARDDAGKIKGLTVAALDITERKQTEQATLAQFKLAETVFNHSFSCQVILDRDYNFVRVNPAYARACQKDIGEFAGRNHFEMYPSDARLIFDDVVRTRRPFEVSAREFTFPDRPELGSTYWDWTLIPVLDQRGEVEYLVFSLNDVTERKRAEAEILKARQKMQVLSARLIVVQEEERIHISRELHAEIGQSMTALKLALRTTQQHLRTDAVMAEAALRRCVEITDATINQVRNLSLRLRPPHLDDLGLGEALRWMLDTQGQAAEWASDFSIDPSLDRIEPEIEATCFRIAQEALTNAARHAKAKRVTVSVHVLGNELHLTVRDDGRGFDLQAAERRRGRRAGLGLVSMQERATLVGGSVSVSRLEHGGTQVVATLPLRRRT